MLLCNLLSYFDFPPLFSNTSIVSFSHFFLSSHAPCSYISIFPPFQKPNSQTSYLSLFPKSNIRFYRVKIPHIDTKALFQVIFIKTKVFFSFHFPNKTLHISQFPQYIFLSSFDLQLNPLITHFNII